jgi:phage N-6-adenine-methyltransferase
MKVDSPAIVRQVEDLASLAEAINAEHKEVEAAAQSSLEHARAAGEMLLRAKEQCVHGKWLPWQKANLRFSDRTARAYMRIASEWDKLATVANLGLRDALQLLAEDEEEGKEKKTAHVSHNSGENERYTPPEYIAQAKVVLGCINLDPASSEVANRTVGAEKIFTAEDDGLSRDWHGNVWLNPPYAAELIGKFVGKLCRHVQDEQVDQSILLVNNATETKWFQEALGVCSAVCFPAGRVKFLDPHGAPSGAPLQGQSLLYFGPNPAAFASAFEQFGFCAQGMRAAT